MSIDTTITIGNLLTLIGLIAAFAVFLMAFRTDIRVLVTRIDQIDKELIAMREEIKQMSLTTDRIGTVLIEMATQRTRMDGIDKRLDDTIAVRQRMQDDLESRFDGLEQRLRAVEGLAHARTQRVVENAVSKRKR